MFRGDDLKNLMRGLALAVAAAVFLTFVGAFNTGEAALAVRLGYWLFLMTTGGLWGHVCASGVERFVDLDERPWLGAATLTAFISVPMIGWVWLISGLVFAGRLYPVIAMAELIGPVLLVTGAVSLINVFLTRKAVATHAEPSRGPSVFLERLPPKLRGARLIAVQAEDHYLRLHTDRGSDLILMRLSDALAELEGLEGAQAHRSWWVSKDAVRDVERGDGRASLTLEGGLTVPVSRRHARALRAAGWW